MLPREKREAAAEAFAAGTDGLEDATDGEQMELLASSGTTLTKLVAGELRPYAPEAVARIRTRIRRRRRLELPHVDCPVDDCSCGSLASALDELDDATTRAKVLRRAWSPRPNSADKSPGENPAPTK